MLGRESRSLCCFGLRGREELRLVNSETVRLSGQQGWRNMIFAAAHLHWLSWRCALLCTRCGVCLGYVCLRSYPVLYPRVVYRMISPPARHVGSASRARWLRDGCQWHAELKVSWSLVMFPFSLQFIKPRKEPLLQ